jgi:hypothetical protein
VPLLVSPSLQYLAITRAVYMLLANFSTPQAKKMRVS